MLSPIALATPSEGLFFSRYDQSMFTSVLLLAHLADGVLEPVPMTEVVIGPAAPITAGTVSDITVGTSTATLFIPDGWKPRRQNRVCLHFHSAPWYVVSQYQTTGLHDPVITFNLGQGSSVYAAPFANRDSFLPWHKAIETSIHGRLGNLVVTSFSAGYGAVRNLIKQPDFLNRLETVVLSDSMYGSLVEPIVKRVVLPEHAACWRPLADRALAGKTTVVMTCSSIAPSTYAGTHEVTRALVESYGFRMDWALLNSCPAAAPGDQRLKSRFDREKWHVWLYDGISPVSHMTQARHMADVLRQIYPGPKNVQPPDVSGS